MQKLGGNSKTPLATCTFTVRLSEFLREPQRYSEADHDRKERTNRTVKKEIRSRKSVKGCK